LTIAIIGILVLAWVAFLAPTLLRARNNQVRADSVGDFRHRLRALGGTGGHRRLHLPHRPHSSAPIFGPVRGSAGGMTDAQRRRRDVLAILAVAVVVTLFAAVFTRSMPMVLLQLVADALLAGYVYLLIQHRQRTQHTGRARALPGAPAVGHVTNPTYRVAEIDLRSPAHVEPRLVPLRQTASS